MSRILSYKASCSLSLITINEQEYPMPPTYVTSIGTDYQYENYIMPIVYLVMELDEPMYNRLIDNVSDGIIHLKVWNFNAEEALGLEKVIFDEDFAYFIPSKYNYSKSIEDPNVNEADYTEHIVIGLLKADLIYKNKKSFNGTFTETSTEKLIKMVFQDMGEYYMDDLEIDTEYEEVLIPPQASRAEVIDYIFNLNPFYETNYQYFMEFDKIFLTNTSGEPKSEIVTTVLFDVEEVNNRTAQYTGFSKDTESGTYIVFVNETDCNVSVNTTTDKMFNQTVSTYTDQITKVDSNITVLKKDTSNKQEFTQANAMCAEIKKQIMDNTAVTININKMNMDSTIITPDKCFMVRHAKYPNYDGKYQLIYKKEMIVRKDNAFDTTTMVGLKKIADK